MASEKVLAFVENVKELTVLELAELVKALEEEFGVSAAAPVAVAAAPAAAAAADYLRAFYADAVRHHRAAVPLLGDHLYHRLRHVPDRGTGKTADPQMAFRLTA